ncbi:hypothetical protein F5884DRAFT_874085 [Xylogone sp. PMI_703]|nr:hypothetical protein F5884DRAFT_874085 [Xylogone sp. PMI_703]
MCVSKGIKLSKCTEGQYNKAFLMTMDNGAEVIAKIPNPNAGPSFYTTASEVATRHFLRELLKLPIPRIYVYSVDPLNPVGADIWYHWPLESQLSLIAQLVDLETKLRSVSFRKHGCICYKEDLESRGIPAHDLEAKSLSPGDPTGQPKSISTEGFALGPLTEARLWEGERAAVNLDRGPWSTPLSYMAAMGINEIRWAKVYARPQINPHRSIETADSPDDYISLLNRYLQVVSYLSPRAFRTSLLHPDLHLDNIFVDPDTRRITCIIDWQSVSVSEPFFQNNIPRMLLPVSHFSPDKRLETTSEGPSAMDNSTKTIDLPNHYKNLSKVKNEQWWAASNLHNCSLLTEPVSLLCSAWSRNDVFSFRHALIHLATRWKEIAPTTQCPIQFTEHELDLHKQELELVEGLGEVLHQLHNDNLIPLGGIILRENYAQDLHINKSVKEMFVNMAESEEQRILYSRIWPYQDQDS